MIKKVDYGVIKFGVYVGKKWSDVPKHYLEYIITPECLTREENKAIAKKELLQRDVCDNQLGFEDMGVNNV